MITFPNAKINLGLNIIEKRPDGYHNLETIFYPINLQDALEVTRRENNDKEYTLHISGALLEGEPEDNLVVKAYKLLKKDYPGLLPVDIHMYKHIPAGAGLGGGSSDAACMIKLLNDKFSLRLSTERMEEYAAKLGADCAFFIRNKPVFATGIGNLFEPVELSLKGY
ncbi:MAG: 4-(cytidine 5'-diphospho)-2-C-methyl-D-erythritol kinase, partial [Bacteroides sp.]|nr:4-(cytidine 5'-diphospho)-2-C-methyl-D-erythritol kinase [Bacteroides sp.]